MKIKNLAALVNKTKCLEVYSPPEEAPGPQWAGDGYAVYSLAGLPKMTCSQVLKAMDIPDAKAAEINTEAKTLPPYLLPYMRELGGTEGMQEIIPADETFSYKGYILCPFTTRANASYLVQTKYMKPLDNGDRLSYWLASDRQRRFIVAYDGLFPAAVLWPVEDTKGNICTYISALATRLKYTSAWSNANIEGESNERD